ncbi:hypothetical protein IGI04_016084 [Brassica rapa subsp. trilocularis]|uniref:Uncharacterized protein n=1 Tax=Brassica rapa subsp. trilocularis TaxID=1813537 RepID=A0ABQ7MRX6_BRACM|nr:hypothetical protein IGI04_016084 [Brassica rapa subsp. trilocularis]
MLHNRSYVHKKRNRRMREKQELLRGVNAFAANTFTKNWVALRIELLAKSSHFFNGSITLELLDDHQFIACLVNIEKNSVIRSKFSFQNFVGDLLLHNLLNHSLHSLFAVFIAPESIEYALSSYVRRHYHKAVSETHRLPLRISYSTIV